jgi:cytochrome c biogenesis protein CcmG/thiol:disulfide interchange protein DsbE
MVNRRHPLASMLFGFLAVSTVLVAIPRTGAHLHRTFDVIHETAWKYGIRRPVPVIHSVRMGQHFPTLRLSSLDGDAITIDGSGGIVVYNVFTSWCPYCVAETAEVVHAEALLRKRGVQFIGIDQGEAPERVAAFAQAYDVRYPILLDSQHVTTAALGARFIPETLVVRDGIVRRIFVGPVNASQIERAVEGAWAT